MACSLPPSSNNSDNNSDNQEQFPFLPFPYGSNPNPDEARAMLHLLAYDGCNIALNVESRSCLLFFSKDEDRPFDGHPLPAVFFGEKQLTQFLYQARAILEQMRKLPVPPPVTDETTFMVIQPLTDEEKKQSQSPSRQQEQSQQQEPPTHPGSGLLWDWDW